MMDEKDKRIKELEEENEALKIKITRMEIDATQKNKRGAGAKGTPEETANEIYERYCKGEKVEALAKEYNLYTGTIYRKIRKLKANKQKRSYSKEEVDNAIKELICIVDTISDATYECNSPVPKSYEEFILYYNNSIYGIDLQNIIRRVSQKYITLDRFLKEEGLSFREPLAKFFSGLIPS
jgi:chaperonin cofactor prefoldin